MKNSEAHQSAINIFHAVLKEVDPYELIKGQTERILSAYHLGNHRKMLMISFGKAAVPMAKAVADYAGPILTKGVVITKYGHIQQAHLSPRINLYEAAHPIPDKAGVLATEKVISAVREADERTLVVCLISGGGSALLVAPQANITLNEKQQITQLLLKAGANIQELNTVRKHISRIKGGRLAELAYPAGVLSLILSDVIGDPLDVIASGPTSPDTSTFQDALDVINRYRLSDQIPPKALDIIVRGAGGEIPETPKEQDTVFQRVENLIIGSNKKAMEIAKAKAAAIGYDVIILSSTLQGEAREVGAWLAKKAIEERQALHGTARSKACLIAGGETTVTVKGQGQGGRNTELALAFAQSVKGLPGITFLSAGTDGTDGPTDAAGAIVDGQTIPRGESMGLAAEDYLNNNDSYSFFKATGNLFVTGPTGTNVMDIQIALLD